jgi:hypothetical protein
MDKFNACLATLVVLLVLEMLPIVLTANLLNGLKTKTTNVYAIEY